MLELAWPVHIHFSWLGRRQSALKSWTHQPAMNRKKYAYRPEVSRCLLAVARLALMDPDHDHGASFDPEALLKGLPDPSVEEITFGALDLDSLGDHPELDLYTDGGCSPNPGAGGWAFIIRCRNVEENGLEMAGAVARSTNNRMEMMAVIRGLLALDRPCRVRLVADSEYVVKGLSEWIDGWKRRNWVNSRRKPVLNSELWRVLDALRSYHQIEPNWTRGHAGHRENERCDALVGQVRGLLR